MINLALISKCPSVKETFSLTGTINFCTDTRLYRHPSAFIAIPGAKVNPLDVMSDLLKAECPIVFYQQDAINDHKVKQLKQQYPMTQFFSVIDSVIFLQELTHLHIVEWKGKDKRNTIFAISGSNGKTTHKEMLSFILKQVLPGKIIATEKNNNNHLGVPLTLLNVTDQTQMVVLELGSNHPGEIKVLCDIASPNAGLTTNIGATHLEFFGTEEKVFEEESYLYHAVKNATNDRGFYLINTDDFHLKRLSSFGGAIRYGVGPESDACISFLEDGAEIRYEGEHLVAQNSFITGRHNKLNLITCLFIATHFYPQLKHGLMEACKNFRPTKNRSEWIQFEGRSIFLDAYNANPSSMKAALEGFKESVFAQGFTMNDACVVLGDMYELGESTSVYHKEIGAFVRGLGFENVFFVGHFASYYTQGFCGGHVKSSSSEFKPEYRSECLKNYPIHFIKGSRGIRLETLFDIS
jgi:UDP-N-acetylmuramoyl-tripeptide--D-alanyl-D-alanine ligase